MNKAITLMYNCISVFYYHQNFTFIFFTDAKY